MVQLVSMDSRHTDLAVQVRDLEAMRFREEIQPKISEWISEISGGKLSVMSVQTRILHAFIRYVPEFRTLLDAAFIDGEGLNIPCTLDNNYLCTVISCTKGPYYRRVVCEWPGGRREAWQLGLGTMPRSGETYIESFILSPYQDVGPKHNETVEVQVDVTDREVQVQDLEKMSFRADIQPEIRRWISNISTLGWTVMDVQKNILHKFRSYVPGLSELLQPAFTDSESLNILCTLDDNYLCKVISCTLRPGYKRIVLVWPGGRQEVWELTLGISPRDGKSYIDNFICSQYQDTSQRFKSKSVLLSDGEGPSGAKACVCALLGRLRSLEETH